MSHKAVFTAKNWQSSGVEQITVAPSNWPNMFDEVVGPNKRGRFFYRKQIHDSRPDAIAYAEKARNKRVASLKKQIAKMEALKFE